MDLVSEINVYIYPGNQRELLSNVPTTIVIEHCIAYMF